MSDEAEGLMDAMVGAQFPGGCDDCDAYQKMSKDADHIYRITVHHDDTCPYLLSLP